MSDGLLSRLEADLTRARKDRDRIRTSVLSMTLSEIRNRRIEAGRDLSDEEIGDVLGKARKRRQEAADQMRAGDREELAAKEETEAGILAEYLPEAMDEMEVRTLIRGIMAEGVTEMGPLMGRLMPRIRGRFDGKEANRIAREELTPA
jgi:uncharacterized protein